MAKSILAHLVLLCFIASCKGQTLSTTTESKSESQTYYAEEFNADSLLASVAYISSNKFQGRKTGEVGAELARAYIISKFKTYNVVPFGDSYEQHFEATLKKKTLKATNVIGLIKGTTYPDKYIVLSAHYDHVGVIKGKIYNGADDNASGVGSLFAIAEYLEKNPPKHSVLLVAFDMEENGLKGAIYFVETALKDELKLVFNINMDMISRSKKNEIYAVGQLTQKELQPIIASIKLPENFSIAKGHEGNDGTRNWLLASDHTPFYKKGIPILYFGVDDHEDYHRPTDDFDRIDKAFYVKAVTVIVRTFVAIDSHYQ